MRERDRGRGRKSSRVWTGVLKRKSSVLRGMGLGEVGWGGRLVVVEVGFLNS